MKKFLFLSIALLALCACGQTTQKEDETSPVLSIEGGQVQGVKADLDGVFVFRGIPYAAPPLGELRWKAPQPVIPWKGVKLADKFGHPGFQSVHYPGGYTTEWGYGDESPYSEDCLYLNVWTPVPGQVDKKLPVALWIHGGGYREGWGSEPEFDAQEWAARGVVLVSINYRLGVFGFLTHPDLEAESPNGVSGNYGILDQIESLKWIKKNIAQFGGDPDNVMIFGQSAGAGSVKTLCSSPLTKGLFNKAVIMSGGGITTPEAAKAAEAAAKASPARTARRSYSYSEAKEGTKKVLDWAGFTDLKKMRAASTTTLYALSEIYTDVTGDRNARITASPVIDGYVSTESFDDAALNHDLPDIPYMMGFTLNDMGKMGGAIGDFCLTREEVGSKAYAYEFARPLPDDGSQANVLKGAFHSSDLWFVFKSLKHCWRPWTKGDWDLSDKMIGAWTNFAKYGDPNGRGETVWQPYTKATPKFMIFKLDDSDAEASGMGDLL